MRHRSWFAGVAAGILLVLSAPTHAQLACPDVEDQQALRPIPELVGKGDGIDTTFEVRWRELCVPTSNKAGTKEVDGKTINLYTAQPMWLRTYVYTHPETGQKTAGYPGPTLRLRKANEDGQGGQRLKVRLENHLLEKGNLLSETDDDACIDPCPADQQCDCSKAALEALINQKCRVGTGNPPRVPQECCCVAKCTQESPNCLHGENTTNLHFHGSHSSPQPPQDFVLLDLKPFGSTPDAHSAHGTHGEVVVGEYQYNVDPFGWRQPEGTHWYHPHKHGSVAVQVANGMAGAMIIEGPFDDWLKQFYKQEKLIVIQQINRKENFYSPQAVPPQVLVNGQIQPEIKGEPGEIQRWRFLNATMSSQTLINITFPKGLEFRQIAMDGVRFSPVNYGCQPLLNFNVNNPSFPCNPNPTGNPSLRFAPGNRADFLVRFPQTETPKGKALRVERKLIPIANDEGSGGGARMRLMQREEHVAPGPAEPALFTVVVDDGVSGNESRPRRRGLAAEASAKSFPTEWPPMPAYLQNVTDQELIDPGTGKKREVKMTFQQFISGTDPAKPWPYNQSPITKFTIDGRQFNPKCANVTTAMGTAAEWTVSNDTAIPHPFHIHTNPFQLFSVKGKSIRENGAEPVWMDTLSMPNAAVNPSKPPADPNTPIAITTSQFVIRQRYEDFTGEYVLHCHFLGHEDRGMMFSVQTVCPDALTKYGVPNKDKPECKGVFGEDALSACN